MPSTSPALSVAANMGLRAFGEQLRAQRKALRISAQATAGAAGLSRVTLHRIERGEASVTMGAYFNVAEALGVAICLTGRATGTDTGAQSGDVSEVPP